MNLHLCQKNYVQMLIDENPLICTCHHVYLDQVLQQLPQDPESANLEKLQEATGASTGCGSCLSKLEGIVECYRLKPQIFK